MVGQVINDVIVDLMASAINRSPDRTRTRQAFLALHHDLFDAIRERDGERASYLARSSLFEVYSPLLEPADHARLRLLLPEQPPGQGSPRSRAD